jgi:hypothetical protein
MRAQRGLIVAWGVILAFLAAGRLTAAQPAPREVEYREYEILVDNAPAGTGTLTVADYEEGWVVADSTAKVRVNVLLFNYVYEFSGREVWHDNVFQRIDSRAIDGAKRLSLKGQVTGDSITLEGADGRPRAAQAPALTTNYWRLPPDPLLGKPIAVIDADNGKSLRLQFDERDLVPLTILGKRLDCRHFQVSGDQKADLWYDGIGRLVRQIGTEDGHKTEVRLIGYRRSRPEGERPGVSRATERSRR